MALRVYRASLRARGLWPLNCPPPAFPLFLFYEMTTGMLMPKAILSVLLSVTLWAMHTRFKISNNVLHIW